MSIVCKICNKSFPSMITSTHLKTHNITTAEYKDLYGKYSLVSDEYRSKRSEQSSGINNPNYGNKWSDSMKESMSNKKSGTIPWNKGIELHDTTMYVKSAEQRELKYKEGILTRKSYVRTVEINKKISDSVKKYAAENKEEVKQRSAKAKDTYSTKKTLGLVQIRKGYKLTKSHKEIAIQTLNNYRASKTAESNKQVESNISLANLTLLNDINENSLVLRCNICNNECSFTKQYFRASKFKIELCPVCYPRNSNRSEKEKELEYFITSLGISCINSARINNKEIDIFCKELNIGFEFNGLYWHSEDVLEYSGYSKTKDYEKKIFFRDKGIRLIQIFEDEWDLKQDIVKSRIRAILGKTEHKIYARKCAVKEINSKVANDFVEKTHLQGKGRANVRLGLYYNNELVSVMTFLNKDITNKTSSCQINRFSVKHNTSIPGAAGKLFAYYINNYNPSSVISYADSRWSDGNLYEQLGFKLDKQTLPNYWYIKDNDLKRYHRYNFRKDKLPETLLTEKEYMDSLGWNRIWDSGSTKWVWTNKGA